MRKLVVFILPTIFLFNLACSVKQVQEEVFSIDPNLPVITNPKDPEPHSNIRTKIILEENLCLGCDQKKKKTVVFCVGHSDCHYGLQARFTCQKH